MKRKAKAIEKAWKRNANAIEKAMEVEGEEGYREDFWTDFLIFLGDLHPSSVLG